MSRKKFKLVDVAPPPCKFAVGQRVKPSEEGMKLGWFVHGEVVLAGLHAIRVKVDRGAEIGFSPDYWEAE